MDGLDVKRGPEGLDLEMMPTRLNHRIFFTHFHSFIIFHSLETLAQTFYLKLVLHLLLSINGAEAYECPAEPDHYSFFPEAETCPGNTSPVSRSQAECLKYQHEHHQAESGHRDQGNLSKSLSPKTGCSNKRKLWPRVDARKYGGNSLQEPKLPAPWSRGVR